MRTQILLIFLLLPFVSAVAVDFDCPKEIFVDDPFSCSLEITEGEALYDVKVEIRKDDKIVSRVWNEAKSSFQSGFYYLKEYIEKGEEKAVLLKITGEGKFNGILKLRTGSVITEFPFDIIVGEAKVSEPDEQETKEVFVKDREDTSLDEQEEKQEVVQENNLVEVPLTPSVISLNALEEPEVEQKVVYKSKNAKVMDYLLYGFLVFIILILLVFLWEKF